MDQQRFQKQLDFILVADKEKTILRQTHLTGYLRQENDAEHAWHMTMMVYLLKEYANEEIDLARTMMMALIHDVVEIDAGDTYAYDSAGKATQAERERLAADRIFGMLPEDQAVELRSLFDEFEACQTPEAKFVRAMDNLQPILLNDANNGRDWRLHQVKASQVQKRQERTGLGSTQIWEFINGLIDENRRKGNLRDE